MADESTTPEKKEKKKGGRPKGTSIKDLEARLNAESEKNEKFQGQVLQALQALSVPQPQTITAPMGTVSDTPMPPFGSTFRGKIIEVDTIDGLRATEGINLNYKEKDGSTAPTSLVNEHVLKTRLTNFSKEFPAEYRQLVEQYFDPRDGFGFFLSFPELDENRKQVGGFSFIILVPRKLSNASDDHWNMHHSDIRHKPLDAGDIAGGIDRFCKQVALNLHYQKHLVTR